jgi:hypothetical protein
MVDLGVQPNVIEAILNHVSGHKAGAAGIYNRSTYAAEKRGRPVRGRSPICRTVDGSRGRDGRKAPSWTLVTGRELYAGGTAR